MSDPVSISLLSPSRGRAAAFKRMVESALDTAANPDQIEVLLYLDNDDASAASYQSGQSPAVQKAVKVMYDVPLRPVAASNRLAEISSGSLLAVSGDDMVYQTQRWDEQLLAASAAYQDQIVCVYPNDGGRAGKEVATQPFITRTVYKLLGYFNFPGCQHFGPDLWMHELFHRLGRLVYCEDAVIRHAHLDQTGHEHDKTSAQASPLLEFDNQMFIRLARWLPVEEQILRQQMRPTAAELSAAAVGLAI